MMKKTVIFILIFVLPMFAITFSYDVSHADYIIKLKNGRKIFVSKYKDTGKHISFYSQGGEVIISKENVEEIKDVEAKADERGMYVPEYSEEPLETPSDAGAADTADDKAESELSKLESELSSIYTQKLALNEQREELLKKQKELSGDVKREGGAVIPSKRRKLQMRAEKLKEDAKSFNERVTEIEKREQAVKSEIKSLEKESSRESTPNM